MILEGKKYSDERGTITFNNDFDASQVKRIYTIENNSIEFVRGWQGHKIEQRWFVCMSGKFEIQVIKIDDFENPSKNLTINQYELTTDALNFLHIPAGCITTIQAMGENSKLLVLSDYLLGEIQDEYRFPLDYFNKN